MHCRRLIGLFAVAATYGLSGHAADAFDEGKYPNLKGQWNRLGPPRWDETSRNNAKAPLTPEYQAKFAASQADMAKGGQADPTYTCLPPGMPRAMMVYEPMEIVITEGTTHILIDHIHDNRRIFTDGRPWPESIAPSFGGYSIGRWIDEDGDGRYDVLDIETRYFKGPRAYDITGLTLHADNQTVIKERIYLDKADPDLLHDMVTTIDHALTEPWTVTKNYRREQVRYPEWPESVCTEQNVHVKIGKENYFLSADGDLMPTRKDQAPPELKYFDRTGQQRPANR